MSGAGVARGTLAHGVPSFSRHCPFFSGALWASRRVRLLLRRWVRHGPGGASGTAPSEVADGSPPAADALARDGDRQTLAGPKASEVSSPMPLEESSPTPPPIGMVFEASLGPNMCTVPKGEVTLCHEASSPYHLRLPPIRMVF